MYPHPPNPDYFCWKCIMNQPQNLPITRRKRWRQHLIAGLVITAVIAGGGAVWYTTQPDEAAAAWIGPDRARDILVFLGRASRHVYKSWFHSVHERPWRAAADRNTRKVKASPPFKASDPVAKAPSRRARSRGAIRQNLFTKRLAIANDEPFRTPAQLRGRSRRGGNH